MTKPTVEELLEAIQRLQYETNVSFVSTISAPETKAESHNSAEPPAAQDEAGKVQDGETKTHAVRDLLVRDLIATKTPRAVAQGAGVDDDELLQIARKAGFDGIQYEAMVVTRWKDGIDIDYATSALKEFARLLLLRHPSPVAQGEADVLKQVQAMLKLWEGGLDRMDGAEYEHACDEWARVYALVNDAMERRPSHPTGSDIWVSMVDIKESAEGLRPLCRPERSSDWHAGWKNAISALLGMLEIISNDAPPKPTAPDGGGL
jgi:hypothetical protein